MEISIKGNNGVDVDASDVTGLNVNISSNVSNSGYFILTGESDDGTGNGIAQRKATRFSNLKKLRVGIDTPLFSEFFPGTAINSAIWGAPNTTMTITQTPGSVQLNAGLSVATNVRAHLYTRQVFPVFASAGISIEMDIALTQHPVQGNQCEWGAFYWPTFPASSSAAITDGVFWRLSEGGELFAVVTFNGTEKAHKLEYDDIIVEPSRYSHYAIIVDDSGVEFFVNDILRYKYERTLGDSYVVASKNIPVSFRVYNNAATSLAQTMKVGAVGVTLVDIESQKDWTQILCGSGGHGSQGQTGATMGNTAAYANNANPAAAVPTNTTAALGTGLGGQFWETNTLALNTDGIISSYQNPAGTVALPGKCLYIYGVWIQSFVQTLLVTGGYNEQWALAYGHTSVSLATSEAATTKAPRRIALGSRSIPAASAVNTVFNKIYRSFTSPIVVQPGEFVAVIKKNVGTVGTGGTLAHIIGFDSCWE